MKDLPRQKKLSILDASNFLGVSTKTLRRWEISHILTSERTNGGHRRYNLEQLREIKNKRPEIRNKSLRKQLKAHSVITPIGVSQVKAAPIVLDAGPLLNPAQINVIKFMSFCFFIALTALIFTKTGINSKYINSYKSDLVSVLPIPGVAKTVLGTTTAQLEDSNAVVIAESNQSSKVLAAAVDRTQPLFSVNIQSSFKEVAEFVKGLNSLDIGTGTLEATGAANLTSTLNVTGATTLSTLTTTGNTAIGGDLTSPLTTFNLLNTGVTTLNVGGAATTTSISATTGTTTVNNNLTVKGALNSSGKITGSGDLAISGATTLSGAETVSGTLTASGALNVSGATALSGNLTKINGVTYSWPTSQGAASSSLVNDGAGTLTWSTSSSGITGSGTSGQVTFFNGASSVTGSSSFTWNNSTSILSTTGLSLTLGSDATGDLFYRNSSGNFARLGVGSSGQTLGVSAGLPAWVGGSGTGDAGFWTRTSTTLSPFNAGDNIATTGKVGIGSTSAPTYQLDLNATTTTGRIFNLAYGSLTALTGDLTGSFIDLDTGNVTATNQNITGLNVKLPTVTNTHTTGTKTLSGFLVDFGTGSGINQNGSGGTTTYNALSASLPALTQTAGTLNVNGLYLTTPSSITTGGTASGINISSTGVGAGTLYGLNIGGITASTGTETALNIGSGWDNVLSVNSTAIINGSGVTQIAGGGTSFSTYTKGDLIYSDATNSLAKLPIGTTAYVLTVSAGGIPSWNTISGSSCTNCLINNPTSDQTVSPTGDTTGMAVRQTSTGSPTHDIFSVSNSTGATKYLYVDSSGVVNIPSIGSSASDQLTITPGTDKFALKLLGTNVASNSLEIINPGNTSGTIFSMAYPSAKTLAGSLTGVSLDLNTNLTVTNQSLTAQSITLPTFTNTNTSGTKAYYGLLIAPPGGGGINQNGSGGTSTYNLVDLTMPALTQTAGTLTSTGVNLTTPSSITTGGTAYGINLSTTGVGAGTLTGINIGNITGGSGTETGISVGTGWDTAADFNAKMTVTDSATTTGSVITATASAITSGNVLKLGQGGNTNFTGNGIFMDFDNTGQGGIGFTGNFLKFANVSSTKFLVDSTGSIGIGMTPTERLSVLSSDNTQATNIAEFYSNNQSQAIAIGYDEIRKAATATDSDIKISAKGAGKIYLRSSGTGKVGVGNNTSLNDIFNVTSDDNLSTTEIAAFLANNASVGVGIRYNEIRTTGTNADGNLTLNPKGTGNLFLANSGIGGVNIGDTTTPTSTLLVNRSFGGNAVAMFNQPTSAFDIITASASGSPRWAITYGGNIQSLAGAKWMPFSDSTTALNLANAAGTAFVAFDTTNSRMRIGSATAPTTTLDVTGAGTFSSDLAVNGSNITTTSTGSFALLNTNATTINAFGAATTISLAGASGLTATLGNANGATALNLTSGTGAQTHTSSVATGTLTSGAFVFKDTALTSGDMIYATASAITSGNIINLGQGGNTNFTGTGLLMDFDNTGQGGIGFTGNFVNFKNATVAKFTVNSAGLITTASVGTGALKTATGSTTLSSGNVTMNDYNFFPNIELDTCVGGALALRNFTTDATDDQIGRFSLTPAAVCSSGTVAVRWRYITASDHPTIWVKADLDGSIKSVWEAEDPIDPKKYPDNPNPLEGNPLAAGEYFASVQPLSVTQLETAFSTLPSADQSQIMISLRDYIVDQRHWLTSLNSISDLSNITERFEPSGRQWAMRIIADHYGLANSGFIQYTTTIVNGSLRIRSDFYSAIQEYLAQKQLVKITQTYQSSLPQNQQNADIAEYYSSDKNMQQPEAGDIVSVSSSHLISKTNQAYDSKVIGIVSTSPNEVLGTMQPGDIKLALTGRVPVKIDPDSDPINPGDFITSSDKPGMAKRASKAGYTVGKALESWNKAANQTTIMVFVNVGYFMGDVTAEGYVRTDQSFIANDIKLGIDSTTFNKLFPTTTPSGSGSASDSATIINSIATASASLTQTISALVDRLQKLEADDVILKNQILLGGTSTPIATDSSQLNNLTVLGKSVLGDTIISGKLNVGGLTVDSTSQSINAIGVLKIQDLALGNVEFMNGLVTIDTNGDMTVKTITADKYKVAGASAGSDKIVAGQTSITISSTQVTDKSLIFVTAKDSTQLPLAVTAKTTGVSFKVEIPNSTTKDINFDWWIVDKQ